MDHGPLHISLASPFPFHSERVFFSGCCVMGWGQFHHRKVKQGQGCVVVVACEIEPLFHDDLFCLGSFILFSHSFSITVLCMHKA
jgi:hypothetical protein